MSEYQLPQPGDLLAGKYRIERLLGQGGMGAVFAAHHEILSERVALKFLLSDIAANQEAIGRFLNEARAAAKIKSQHVCRIMDAEVTSDGLPFMVLEYLEGQDLAQVLEERQQLPYHEAVDYVLQALEPVHQAHTLGIVHRDLKPANLFLCKQPDGGTLVKVLDFGISKAQNPLGEAANGALTSTKAMLGSPLYMSPEQLRSSKRVTAVSDIWSLGVILYELMTGAVPYGGDTLGELFATILEEEPVPPCERNPAIPVALSAIVMACLRKKDSERTQSVSDLASALIPYGTGTYGAALARGGAVRSYAEMEAVGTGPNPVAPSTTGAVVSQSGVDGQPAKKSQGALMAVASVALVAILGGSGAIFYKLRQNSGTKPVEPVATLPVPATAPVPTAAVATAPLPTAEPSATATVVVPATATATVAAPTAKATSTGKSVKGVPTAKPKPGGFDPFGGR